MAPPPNPKNPQPGAPKQAGPLVDKGDRLEPADKNVFGSARKIDFQPTPLKSQFTGDVPLDPHANWSHRPPRQSTGPKPPPQKPAPAPLPPPGAAPGKLGAQQATPGSHVNHTVSPPPPQATLIEGTLGQTTNAAFLLPGMSPAGQAARKPLNVTQGTSAVAARPLMRQAAAVAAAQQAAPGGGKKSPPSKPAVAKGVITNGDSLAYQGRLPVYVGRAEDGNPMIDAEDARFVFDPLTNRVQIQCKVASIMLKAACLHLGIPPPDRGPRRFLLNALLKADLVKKHRLCLFDGNLEVRLTAMEAGRPVLLDLTQFEAFNVSPDV